MPDVKGVPRGVGALDGAVVGPSGAMEYTMIRASEAFGSQYPVVCTS
jgi:hypothetical protein